MKQSINTANELQHFTAISESTSMDHFHIRSATKASMANPQFSVQPMSMSTTPAVPFVPDHHRSQSVPHILHEYNTTMAYPSYTAPQHPQTQQQHPHPKRDRDAKQQDANPSMLSSEPCTTQMETAQYSGSKKRRSSKYQPPRQVPTSVVSVTGSLANPYGMRRQLSSSQLDQFLSTEDDKMDEDDVRFEPAGRRMSI